MYHDHLLFYIISIILFSKVDVLLSVDTKKRVSFLEDTEVQNFRSQDAPNTINKPQQRVSWGPTDIKIFDSRKPLTRVTYKVGKKGSRFRKVFGKKPHCQDIRVNLFSKYINKFSLNGRIWHHVWNNSLLYSCIASKTLEKLQKNFYMEINYYRRIHNSAPLLLDPYLSSKALNVARRSARIGRWVFNGKKSNGVNYATINVDLSPLLMNIWYQERKKYNYRTLVGTPETMHFSNLVWKATKKVGIGIAKKGLDLFVCLMFFPEGNQEFQFRDNVKKAKYHLIDSRKFFRE
uniref:SCP domain-containing protein n=1 Tax=Strongyloides venezuelensis TaxID=75913 RepID=A0A0K0G203_STRVS